MCVVCVCVWGRCECVRTCIFVFTYLCNCGFVHAIVFDKIQVEIEVAAL